MNEPFGEGDGLPVVGIIATVLVAAGVLLWMFVSRGLLIVAALGAFGPGLLRETGLLRDHDEFQRRAAHRAGYHAYLVGGLAAMLVLSAVEWGGGAVDESAEWIRFVVVVLWLTWLSSTLLMYWGARRTTSRVLAAFGSFWAVFVAATLVGDASRIENVQHLLLTLLGVLVGIGVVAPFFVLAWTARRWPRGTGMVLVGVTLVFLLVFGRKGGVEWSTRIMTDALLMGPLATCGLALLLERDADAAGEGDAQGAGAVA